MTYDNAPYIITHSSWGSRGKTNLSSLTKLPATMNTKWIDTVHSDAAPCGINVSLLRVAAVVFSIYCKGVCLLILKPLLLHIVMILLTQYFLKVGDTG